MIKKYYLPRICVGVVLEGNWIEETQGIFRTFKLFWHCMGEYKVLSICQEPIEIYSTKIQT